MTLLTAERPAHAPSRTPRRRRLAVGLAVTAAGVAGVALAAAPSDAAPATGVPATRQPPVLAGDSAAAGQALQLLARAARAARTTPYTGVQYVTSWDGDRTTSVVADISHLPGVGAVVQVRKTAGGGGERMLDTDDQRTTSVTAPSDAELRLLGRHYVLSVDGTDAVDGRPASVVAVRRPDGSLAARFWIDRASGLVLRRELLDPQGRMVRTSVFVELRLTPDVSAAEQPTTPIPLPWAGRVEPVQAVASLVPRGYHVALELPGGFVLYDARLGSTSSGRVLHLSYSDGLTTLSVFEQPGRLDTSHLTGWRRERIGGVTVWAHSGMPGRLSWSGEGTVYTVLSDAPVASVAAVVAALPRGGHHRALLARLGPGLERIGSWLNPFA